MDWAYLLYVKVFPYTSIFFILILLYLRLRMPKSIWTMIAAWMSRDRISVAWVADDDGWMGPEIVKSKLGQGIFESTGTKVKSLLMRPISPAKIVKQQNETQEQTNARRVNEDEKVKAVNEIVGKRYRLDIGKMGFFGYRGKALIASPAVLEAISQSEQGEKVLDVLDPADLKVYFPKTINPAQLDSIEETAYWDGYYDKPRKTELPKWAIPAGVIIVLLAFLYLIYTGKLHIPGVM